jgi:hypothetical protein
MNGETMRQKGVCLLALAVGAMLASVSEAVAKEPVKLTEAQMDHVTAGGTNPLVSSLILSNLVPISLEFLNMVTPNLPLQPP